MSAMLMYFGKRRTSPLVASNAAYTIAQNPYSYDANVDFAVTGGVPPYTFTPNVSLPGGLSRPNASSTRLTGTPTQATTQTFNIPWTVTDAAGQTATLNTTIEVRQPPSVGLAGSLTIPAGTPNGTRRGFGIVNGGGYWFVTNDSSFAAQGNWVSNDIGSQGQYEMFVSVSLGTPGTHTSPTGQWVAIDSAADHYYFLTTPGRFSLEIRRKNTTTVLSSQLIEVN